MSGAFTKQRVAIGLGAVLVLAVVLVAVTRGIGDASVPSDDVAVIDGNDITKAEFDRSLEQAAKRQGLQQAPTPDSPQYQAIRDQALGDLFDIAWIQGEAEDRGISVSDREVQQQLTQTKNQSFKSEADYQQFLRQSGFTQEDVDLRIKLQLLSQKIQEEVGKAAGTPSSDDIQKYYDANKSQYAQPEQRDLRVIVNQDPAKVDQALSQLQADNSDANWKKVAAEFSTDPTSKNLGGVRKSVTEGVLPAPVDSQVFAADEGALLGPIATPAGTYIVQVDSITPATTQPLDDQLKAQITQQLTGQKQQEYFADFLADYREHWINLTICADDYLNERCDNFDVPATECTPEQASQAGCPPPVLGTSPAAPGSILPFTPAAGQPQRPHPPGGETPAAPTFPGAIPGAPTPGAPTPGATGAAPPGG